MQTCSHQALGIQHPSAKLGIYELGSSAGALDHYSGSQDGRFVLWDRCSLWMCILIAEGHVQRCKAKINQAAKPAVWQVWQVVPSVTVVTDDAISAWLAIDEVS